MTQLPPTSPTILIQHLNTIRTTILPYLPPPIIKLISTIDEYLKPHTDEGCMILLFTSLLSYLIYVLLQILKGVLRSRYSLVEDDDDVMNLLSKDKKKVDVSSTILLCGISGSGKTILFHKLSQTEKGPSSVVVTVPSLKAAEEFLTSTSSNTKSLIRMIDFPGHASLRSSPPLSCADKIIFLLDSSKSITESAHFLFSILTHNTKPNPNKHQREMLIVCNKADLPLAKNLKRIKLQLRTELERLRKVKGVSTLEENLDIVLPTSFDLDSSVGLQFRLSFVQSSCVLEQEGFQDIRNFVFGVE